MYYDDIDFDAINKGQSDTKKCNRNKIFKVLRSSRLIKEIRTNFLSIRKLNG